MRVSSRAPRPAREADTPWLPWAATSSYSEGTRTKVRRHAARAGNRLGTCQISRRQLLRALLLCARGCMVSEQGCRAWCHQGPVVTHGAVQPFLRWHRVSQRAYHEEHVHNVVIESRMVHRWCRVEDRIGM